MKRLIQHFGSQEKLARELGCSHQNIQYWKKKGVPPRRAIEIEKKTNGLFTRRMLCPEFFE
jgi:DNA-binding transcriptional regulator YdaS (Cro superfamily)